MAAGIYEEGVSKVRPGVYGNIKSNSMSVLSAGDRGTAFVILPAPSYGPKGAVTITAGSMDGQRAKLGFSVYDDNSQMLLIREAFKNASTVIAYIPAEGTKATVTASPVTATAKYGGTRGNDLAFTVVANPLGGFDVRVSLAGSTVAEYEGLTTVADLAAQECPYITFTGTGNLTAVAGKSLTGGTDATVSNSAVTDALDASENYDWNAMAFPFDDSALKAAAKAKIKYFRQNMGRGVQVVVPDFSSADYEGVIAVTNAYAIDGQDLTHAQACAWVAGASAAASKTESLTYVTVEGASAVVSPKTNEDAITALKSGEFFFSVGEGNTVIVEQDINSFHSFTREKNQTFGKNRVLRVYDELYATIQANFRPNQFSNNPDDWAAMEGIGIGILKNFEAAGAIRDLNEDTDFSVDREKSVGDETFYSYAITAVDSAEKLYFSGTAR